MDTTTGQNSEKEGASKIWEMNMESTLKEFQKSIGVDYKNDASYKIIISLFEKAKEQEIKFRDQADELKSINDNATKLIETVREDTVDFKKKISDELGLWRYFIIGALVVVGISFISLTIDTFWRRNDEFQKININYSEKNNILENRVSNIEELNSTILKQQNVLDCLKYKGYFTIKCFQ